MGNAISKAKSRKKRSKPASEAARDVTTDGSSRLTAPTIPLRFSHYPRAQQEFVAPLIYRDNHFLGDVYESDDKSVPISCGFYHLKPGSSLEYAYSYDEMKIVLEGEVRIRDATGQEILATPGDVFYFPKGSVITFSTDTLEGAKAFYCGQRAKGTA